LESHDTIESPEVKQNDVFPKVSRYKKHLPSLRAARSSTSTSHATSTMVTSRATAAMLTGTSAHAASEAALLSTRPATEPSSTVMSTGTAAHSTFKAIMATHVSLMLLTSKTTHTTFVMSAVMATTAHASAHLRTASHAAAEATGSALMVLLGLLLILLRLLLVFAMLLRGVFAVVWLLMVFVQDLFFELVEETHGCCMVLGLYE
jgi:hypothetical protein